MDISLPDYARLMAAKAVKATQVAVEARVAAKAAILAARLTKRALAARPSAVQRGAPYNAKARYRDRIYHANRAIKSAVSARTKFARLSGA